MNLPLHQIAEAILRVVPCGEQAGLQRQYHQQHLRSLEGQGSRGAHKMVQDPVIVRIHPGDVIKPMDMETHRFQALVTPKRGNPVAEI